MVADSLAPHLSRALAARAGLLDLPHETAIRLFNGFVEGDPELVVDLYGRTLLLHNYADEPGRAMPGIQAALGGYLKALPWLQAAVLKVRAASNPGERRGVMLFGQHPDRKIRENGVWYAIDLLLNRDASLYLDTRLLRAWAKDNLAGKSALNTFAYTGSLGVAAMAGGASRVLQLDLNRRFLKLAQDSYRLNGLPVRPADFLADNFWPAISALKNRGELFDCVFLDPPYFAASEKGQVDLLRQPKRLINKVRPLIKDGGWLVAINNALFLSGADYIRALEELCADGYLHIEQLIPVPEDFTGYPQTRVRRLPVDPAPFNHSTKIAVLRVRRKSEK